jgi:ABC-type glycerol-3-phosphate transport system substrate-binding protein
MSNPMPDKRKKFPPMPAKPGAGIKGRYIPSSLIKGSPKTSKTGEDLAKKVKTRKMTTPSKKREMVDYGYMKVVKGGSTDKYMQNFFKLQREANKKPPFTDEIPASPTH